MAKVSTYALATTAAAADTVAGVQGGVTKQFPLSIVGDAPHTVVTPAQIAAATDNYAPGAGTVQRWSSDAARTVTGVVAGADGETRIVWNIGSFPITLSHEVTSTAANRFTCAGGASIVFGPGECALMVYSTATSRWLVTKARSDIAQGTLIVRQPGGTPGTHEVRLFYDTSTHGYVHAASGILGLTASSFVDVMTSPGGSLVARFDLTLGGMNLGTAQITGGVNASARDVGFVRVAAAVWRASNGSTGVGSLLSGVLVEANTAGSGAPNVLLSTESGTVLTNEGAAASNYHSLPTAAAGYQFTFIAQDADGMRITAAAGDTIRDLATVSATAGFIQTAVQGSTLTLISINATEWVVVAKQGTWTVDA